MNAEQIEASAIEQLNSQLDEESEAHRKLFFRKIFCRTGIRHRFDRGIIDWAVAVEAWCSKWGYASSAMNEDNPIECNDTMRNNDMGSYFSLEFTKLPE